MKILILFIIFITLGALLKTFKLEVKAFKLTNEKVLTLVNSEKDLDNKINQNQKTNYQSPIKITELDFDNNFLANKLIIINVLVIVIIFFALFLKIKYID